MSLRLLSATLPIGHAAKHCGSPRLRYSKSAYPNENRMIGTPMKALRILSTSTLLFLGLIVTPGVSNASAVATEAVSSTPVSVTAGPDRTCAVYSDGALYCWGTSTKGNLGTGDLGTSIVLAPTRVKHLPPVSSVAIGTHSTCAVTTENAEVYCWGDNSSGSLATANLSESSRPIKIPGMSAARKVVISGTVGTCALLGSVQERAARNPDNYTIGTIYCWGAGTYSPTHTGETRDIVAGSSFFCRTANNGYYCFDSFLAPNSVRTVSGFRYQWTESSWLVAGQSLVCGRNDTFFDAWNGFNCMGYYNYPFFSWDSLVSPYNGMRASYYAANPRIITLGSNYGCIVTPSGVALCWGYNDRGQMGLGGADSNWLEKMQFVPLSGISSLSAAALGKHTCAVSVGNIYCWGANDKGQLGDASLTDRNSPTLTALKLEQLSLTPEPTISGASRIGSILIADVGIWDEGSSLVYQWLSDGQPIAGANEPAYLIKRADLNRRISYLLTVSKAGYSTVSATAPSKLVSKTFSRVTTPVLKGVSKVGQVLSNTGSPMGSGVSYSYQWLRDGVAIEGAIERKYALTPDDLGATMSLRVCGAKYLYETTCVVAVNSNVIALGELSRKSTVSLTSTSNKVGDVLEGRTNSWDADVELSYSWLRDGVEIEGEYDTTYQLTDDDRKHSISFKVLAQKPGYKDVSKTSRAKRVP